MPKAAAYKVSWVPVEQEYVLTFEGRQEQRFSVEDAGWFSWLREHTAFSFQGRSGQLNVLKESRPRGGEGYWYAYQRHGKRMTKKYIGATGNVTLACLEKIAQEFSLVQDTSDKRNEVATLTPLLMAKLQLPRLHASLIARERLLLRLRATLERKLTLLCAPAGFGKTTVVRQWIEEQRRQQADAAAAIAWVSLDKEDNDPVRFWRYVFTASQHMYQVAGQNALRQLTEAVQPPFKHYPLELVLTTFLNEIAHSAQEGVLVLEDYHLIDAPQVHDTLTFLLNHLPTQLHVVIMTRTEPPLPLARLRAANELNELSLSDLRFSQAEMQAFLRQTIDLHPSADVLHQLESQLEGWAAGLRLLALTAQGQQHVEQALLRITGGRSAIQTYFVAEVLQAQKPEVQHFLLHTGILQRLTGPLCDALTERQGSADILRKLAQENVFVETLDEHGVWYRYHALFAEAMQQEARQRWGVEKLQHLFKQASYWYEQHHFYADAVEATLQARDFARAVTLIEQGIQQQHFTVGFYTMHKMHEFHTMRRWLEQVPLELREASPLLSQVYATALMLIFMGNRFPLQIVSEIDRALTLAERGWQSVGNTEKLAEIYAFRSLNEKHHGTIEHALELARAALNYLPDDEYEWRSISLGVLATATAEVGKLDEAERILLEIQVLHKSMQNPTFRRANTGMLSGVYIEQGKYQRASTLGFQLLAEARHVEDQDDVAHVLLGLARIAYEWNDLDKAWQMAEEVLELGQKMGAEEFQLQAQLLYAQIAQARGDEVQAQQVYMTLLQTIQVRPDPQLQRWQYEVERWQALLHWQTEQEIAFQRWLYAPAASGSQRETHLEKERKGRLVARWLIKQGLLKEAEEKLQGLRVRAEQDGRFRDLLAVHVQLAHLAIAQKQLAEAKRIIHNVLVQAQPEGYIRLFLDEGDDVEAVLRSLLPNISEKPLVQYAQKIIRAFAQHNQQRAVSAVLPAQSMGVMEPLSQQETRVLRLLARGHTNQEIAGELIVSVNTVRTQIQSIYRKLAVHNRVQAGEVARRLELV